MVGLIAGACACLELLAHLEPWQELTLPLRRGQVWDWHTVTYPRNCPYVTILLK